MAPAEVCQIERGQICKRIPDELRADMVKFSAIRPEERKKKILDEVSTISELCYFPSFYRYPDPGLPLALRVSARVWDGDRAKADHSRRKTAAAATR